MDEAIARRKRINRLKKMILGVLGLAILIPVLICIMLVVKLSEQKQQNAELLLQLASTEAKAEASEVSGVFTTARVEESPRENIEILEAEQEETESVDKINNHKRIYLTFDDGPSSNTAAILDILKQYDVKATFFVIGKTDEQSRALYQRIVAEGHTLGMHSYSHKYDEIYASKESFVEDLTQLQEYLYDVTGVWPRYYRFPGGSSNTVSRVKMQELIAYLNDNDITYFDWNVGSGDAVSGQLSKDVIINNCLSGMQGQQDCVVLLHDTAERDTTVAALSQIITEARMKENVSFLPINDDTPPIQHLSAE